MSGTADRIRRILSDAGASLKRASELPPVAPHAAGEEVGPVKARLLERLRSLRAGQRAMPRDSAPIGLDGPAIPVLVLPEEDGDDRPLAERVGGVVRSGPRGSFLFVERRWPLASSHGNVPLAEVPEHLLPLRRREKRPGSITHVDPRTAVYLDVETTGLAGGTGTVAFLVGAGRIEGDAFVVRQYFVRDFPDEPAVLSALADDLGDAPLVTFNGRSFDWPLLTTRWRIHRTPVADRDHVDLLPPSRQLWAGSLASHALGQLERHVLGVVRTHDLPGALIPSAYFAWLREAKATAMTMAFHHNEVDIVSMAILGAVIGRVLRDPAARPGAPASDHLGTAKLLVNQGDLGKAKACLEAAVAGGCDDGSPALLRLLGRLHRQAGDLDAATRTWERWRREGPAFDAHPYEELAKLLEHRRKDLPAALATVEDAIARCPRADGRREGLEHRAARLRRRLTSRPAGSGRATGKGRPG